MDDQRKSILDTLYDYVNHGVEWGLNQVKNPCPPRKKYGQRNEVPPPETELKEKIDVEVELDTKVQAGIGDDSNIQNEFSPKYSPCHPNGPYIHPDQICPDYNVPACCFIPMQYT
ncbi:uncharacterized protein LOC117171428 isoform X2 [Belonocnema kinseyi]|uniref:uncharacterized protein LOC117171428 isoform X2 n=1 Tax=Belonocnema kinseyi TaxID=2817044 RepID=UPI00143CFD6E|nr:uncharacterized protein LOC117171428 isoform X2 [Belonocnema kinseyi]